MKKFEYKLVNYKESFFFWSRKNEIEALLEIIREHAEEGWRLVQIFAPASGASGFTGSKYTILIFEREIE